LGIRPKSLAAPPRMITTKPIKIPRLVNSLLRSAFVWESSHTKRDLADTLIKLIDLGIKSFNFALNFSLTNLKVGQVAGELIELLVKLVKDIFKVRFDLNVAHSYNGD
jgi:hypothetical protein